MKKLAAVLFFFAATSAYAQQPGEEKAIQKVLDTFMDCISKKDSITFYTLFIDQPVWLGVAMEASYQSDLKTNPKAKRTFGSNHKSFIRSIYRKDCEEKFYNVRILEDGYVATVYFDYSFWANKEKKNWGAETWGLMKIDGAWKITSVIFSYEEEKVRQEPGD